MLNVTTFAQPFGQLTSGSRFTCTLQTGHENNGWRLCRKVDAGGRATHELGQFLVHHPDQRPIVAGDELRATKCFHVSPFFPVRGEYRFRFEQRGAVHAVSIDLWDGGELQLSGLPPGLLSLATVYGVSPPLNIAESTG